VRPSCATEPAVIALLLFFKSQFEAKPVVKQGRKATGLFFRDSRAAWINCPPRLLHIVARTDQGELPMRLKTLKSIEDLDHYRHTTEQYIDVLLPLEYLQQSKVVVFRHRSGELCGGYTLVRSGTLRVLNSIPDKHRKKITLDLSNVAEITGLWLDARKARHSFCSILFWLHLYVDLVVSPFDGFVYAYTLKKRNLKKTYSTFAPITLYEGETKQQEGMSGSEIEAVEFISKKSVVLSPLLQYRFATRRILFALRMLCCSLKRKSRQVLTL